MDGDEAGGFCSASVLVTTRPSLRPALPNGCTRVCASALPTPARYVRCSTRFRRVIGEAVAGYRGNDDVERVIARPPCAVGSVSGLITFRNSITEPGQPCVSPMGSAFACLRPHVQEMEFQVRRSRCGIVGRH